MIQVVPYDPTWPTQFAAIASSLSTTLDGIPIISIEHVGSTSVPGLAAKPIIDVDIVVSREDVDTTLSALNTAGFIHKGNLGLVDREAVSSPPEWKSNVYVCVKDSLHVRNHLAVRHVLRENISLREEYGNVKRGLAAGLLHMHAYVAGKSGILQKILAESDLTDDEKRQIHKLNDPDADV